MELRQLRYFLAVVDEANFTRAADRLHVSQPGVSAQIRQLERELGHDLLDRSGRTVTLTEVGAAVLPYARAAVAAASATRDAADAVAGLLRGHVGIGSVPSAALDFVELLADFHARYPDIEMTLTEQSSENLLKEVRTGRLDLAFVGLAGDSPPGVACRVVREDALVAVVAHTDPLADRPAVDLHELAARPLITLPRGTGIRSALDASFADAGLRARIAFEASDPRVAARLAQRGLGTGILPASEVAQDDDRGLVRAVAITPRVSARLALVWRAQGPLSPAAGALGALVTARS
ncbi:LysR family transcriptional regulator [Prescottella agglutinans]|jgi:DNA-binding transcriptional LysR family regulator|uniref:DNA-binding transcriptional LysR family regulator n=1 Tax=Prescottella agglutinans TaxID=1644129 RepID=A0ABT6MK17_9NOCA|nr:LysR family transcriptional regulator [Prescottella agglutinans]MDH6284668.1 DNA-binding transcriptional LysR family regulator [Prescottella agglutinans]